MIKYDRDFEHAQELCEKCDHFFSTWKSCKCTKIEPLKVTEETVEAVMRELKRRKEDGK